MSLSDIQSELTDALLAADIPGPCVVTTQEVSGPPLEPVLTNVPHNCKGWRDEYRTAERANGDVLVNDRKIFVVVSTLAITPAPGNTVTIDGATYGIITVSTDPARAAWVLQCRV